VPHLSVLRLTSSFEAIWPSLATEFALPVEITSTPDVVHHPDRIVILAAGGEEPRAETLLSTLEPANRDIAVVGALPSHRMAVSVLRAGAAEYFALPDDLELLRSWLQTRVERRRAALQAAAFARSERSKYTFEGILGNSPALRDTLDRAARIIPHSGVTVLIAGETGTGKELLARALHYNGPRRAAPFVDINCAAIPEQLLESELFGHEKGAFTDAGNAKAGLFELADQGTLFLDEIGHLALPLQGKLLRALEERQIRRVGGVRPIPIDVRVVAATHVDLAGAVRSGLFREDLYYRLHVVPLTLPALRERPTDIPLLVRHFVTRVAREYGLPVPSLSPDADARLREHPWPGNIRELRNVIERAVLLCHDGHITTADLSLGIGTTSMPSASELPFPSTLASLERAAAEAMLARCDGNKSEAARRLAISRPRLLRLLDRDGASSPLAFDGADHAS